MAYYRYQAAGFYRDGIVTSGIFRTVKAARDTFFEENPAIAYCVVKRVKTNIYGDVKPDPSFTPQRFTKFNA